MSEQFTPGQETESRFEYSPENPPPLDVLESKMFGVHVTSVLPKHGVMIAGAQDDSPNKYWTGNEPPSFRPTIHFSLGSILQDQRDYFGDIAISWDKNPYAIVSPLKAMKGQLINIHPNDTYILGNYRLDEDSILLIPSGTKTFLLPGNVQIVEYNPNLGLRSAVDKVIKDRKGWSIHTQTSTNDIGSTATIDNVDINNVDFFKSLFEENPYISYGLHGVSERGEGFRFGIIDLLISDIMRKYRTNESSDNTIQMKFYRTVIGHNLTRLTQFLQTQQFPSEALSSFTEKSMKLQGWLNIIDIDLELREKYGKMLPNPLTPEIIAKRKNIDELRSAVDEQKTNLQDTPKESTLSAPLAAEVMQEFSLDEFNEFLNMNLDIFLHMDDMPDLYVQYAIRRWIIEESASAHKNGLDRIVKEELGKINNKKSWEPIFDNLKLYLSSTSNRLDTALYILQQPYVHDYLERIYNIQFPEGEPKTLDSVLKKHPSTAVLFNPTEQTFTEDQRIAYDVLNNLGFVDPIQSSFNDFQTAYIAGILVKSANSILLKQITDMTQPMNSSKDVSPGMIKHVYKLLHQEYKNPVELWRNLDLGIEYRKSFPQDELFWNSEKSLLEIYKMLKISKEHSNDISKNG